MLDFLGHRNFTILVVFGCLACYLIEIASRSGNYSGTPLIRQLRDKLDYVYDSINAELFTVWGNPCEL